MKKRGRGGVWGCLRKKSKNRLNKHCALPVGQGRGGGGHLRFEKGPGIVRLRAVPLGRFN